MNDWTGKSGYIAAGGLVGLANLTPNQWYMLIGTILGIATFAVNVYYKQQTKKHQDRMREIAREQDKEEEEEWG